MFDCSIGESGQSEKLKDRSTELRAKAIHNKTIC